MVLRFLLWTGSMKEKILIFCGSFFQLCMDWSYLVQFRQFISYDLWSSWFFNESKINVGMYDTWVKHLRDYSRLIQTRLLWEDGCGYGISFWAQNEEAAKSERMDSVYSKLSLFIYKLNKAFLGLSSCFLHCGLSPPQYWLYLAPIKELKGYKTITVPKVFYSSSKTAVVDDINKSP